METKAKKPKYFTEINMSTCPETNNFSCFGNPLSQLYVNVAKSLGRSLHETDCKKIRFLIGDDTVAGRILQKAVKTIDQVDKKETNCSKREAINSDISKVASAMVETALKGDNPKDLYYLFEEMLKSILTRYDQIPDLICKVPSCENEVPSYRISY